MDDTEKTQQIKDADRRWFSSTHWSIVLAAGQSESPQAGTALEKLCHTYWQPLCGYVRGKGHTPEDAQDLTQAFFARLLEKNWVAQADRQRGKFRSFLLTAMNHFLNDALKHSQAEKRGGGCTVISLQEGDTEMRSSREPVVHDTPEKEFDRSWAFKVLDMALAELRQEFATAGKERQLEELKPFLSDASDEGAYAAAATRLGMTAGAVSVAVHRLRQRYRQLVRAQVAHTVGSPDEIDAEMAWLFEVLSG